MMTAATGMTDEDLRLMAVGLANGDVGNASRIVEFVRPAGEAKLATETDPAKACNGEAWPDWEGSTLGARMPWTETERTYIVLDDKEKVVARFTRMNDLSLKGAANAMSWSRAAGPGPFWVYAYDPASQLSGFVGTTRTCGFVDENIYPDTSMPLPTILPRSALDAAPRF